MAIFHLTLKSGSRHKGASAARKSDYITRQKQYENQQDRCLHHESGNLPTWAKDDPRDYWQSADKFERANARLYVEAEFALPRELDHHQRLELARSFAKELTQENTLPYTLSLHEGKGDHRQADLSQTQPNDQTNTQTKTLHRAHNPHAHLLISERSNDGLARTKADWFKRANKAQLDRGGAPKVRQFHGRQKIHQMRERFAELTNQHLEKAKRLERVSHLSLEAQGIDRSPGLHHGPVYYAMKEKGLTSQRELKQSQQLEHQRHQRTAQTLEHPQTRQAQLEREAKAALERRMLERQAERETRRQQTLAREQQAKQQQAKHQEREVDGGRRQERELERVAGRDQRDGLGRDDSPYGRDDLERETRDKLARERQEQLERGGGLEQGEDNGRKADRKLDYGRGLDLG